MLASKNTAVDLANILLYCWKYSHLVLKQSTSSDKSCLHNVRKNGMAALRKELATRARLTIHGRSLGPCGGMEIFVGGPLLRTRSLTKQCSVLDPWVLR